VSRRKGELSLGMEKLSLDRQLVFLGGISLVIYKPNAPIFDHSMHVTCVHTHLPGKLPPDIILIGFKA